MPDIVDDVLAAWERYADELADLPNVTSVGMGYRVRGGKRTRTPALVVTVRRKLAPEQLAPSSMVPREVPIATGARIEVDVVEDPQEYTIEQDTATYRPVPGGCEIGRWGSGSVGTLGGWFCRRRDDRSGWNPVWLTNAHVASPNSSTIPADARITQPGGGGVIGVTTAIVGYPTPGPAMGTTVNGVCDAAVGALDEDVDPDYQVLQVAPAPFEIGEAASGQAVQKRGRTSLRTDGTVEGAAGIPPWITVDMGSPNSAGTVRFGSPGNPRVFRVRSNASGLAAAFTRPGDSGSLYFASQAGRLASTFPALGLHFAGTFRWASGQPNPDDITVTSVGFDLGGVMAQLQLDTVCNCVLRAILDAIFGPGRWVREDAAATTGREATGHAESLMRQFRSRVLSRTKVGKQISDAVSQTAPDVARVLSQDPIAFGLAVDLLRPWATAATSLAVLGRELDADTLRLARDLGDRVMELAPETEARIRPMIELLEGREGEPVRKLLGRSTVTKLPTVERAEPDQEKRSR